MAKLVSWNCNRLKGSLKGAIDKKLQEINSLDRFNQGELDAEIDRAEKDLDGLLEEEEKYWRLRAREDWLNWGDKIPSGFTPR